MDADDKGRKALIKLINYFLLLLNIINAYLCLAVFNYPFVNQRR